MARESFQQLADLVAALERGAVPRNDVCLWFTSAIARWVRAADTRPLAAHLGISHRLRRQYIISRQRGYLDEALHALAASRQDQSDYALAGEFVQTIERTARALPIDNLEHASTLVRSLALALTLPNHVPRSREHWRQQLVRKSNPVVVCEQHDEISLIEPDEGFDLKNNTTPERTREQLEAEWQQSPELQQEFGNAEQYVAFMDADQKGLVKLFRQARR